MSQPLQPQKISNLGTYGVVREAQVDSSLIPDGAVTDSVNFHFDRIGAATVRPGLAVLGATVLTSRPCVGLHNAQAGTAISVFSNGGSATIYTLSSGTWGMSLDGGTASVRIRFIDFASYTIALNFMYNTYTSMRFWNAGSSRHWHVSGNPLNTDQMYGRACQLGEVYKSRIYLGGDTSREGNTSRLYYSEVITSAGIVTWDKTNNYVDINPGDGEGMTGLKRYSLELLVFKPNYIYRFKTSSVDPDPLIKIGTRSHESIVEGKKGLYFHHDTGFYKYTGGYPTEISKPIQDFIDAIPFSQYDDITSWNDADHIYWSIGNVSIQENKETITYKNCVLRYSESSEVWTVYSYSSDIRRGIAYNSGSALTRIVGTDMGVVATHNSGTTDLGEPLKYRIRTKWYDWGSTATSKVINELVATCEKAQGSELMYRMDEETEWRSIGQIKKFSNLYKNLSIRFKRIRFQVTGISRLEAPVFLGIDVIKGLDEGLIKD